MCLVIIMMFNYMMYCQVFEDTVIELPVLQLWVECYYMKLTNLTNFWAHQIIAMYEIIIMLKLKTYLP
jgi:hypothetical protein